MSMEVQRRYQPRSPSRQPLQHRTTGLPMVLRSIDPSCNRARFYTLSIEPTLFGDVALVRHWGRIGSPGRHRIDLYRTSGEALDALQRLASSKRSRGYSENGAA